MKSIKLIDELIVKAIDQHDEPGDSAACVLESIKAAVLADFHDEAIDEMVQFNMTNVEMQWKSAVKEAVNEINAASAEHAAMNNLDVCAGLDGALAIIGLKTGIKPTDEAARVRFEGGE
jgi:hypothetical protein